MADATKLKGVKLKSPKTPKERVERRLKYNMKRVGKLQDIATSVDADSQGDILRSAVVLLHATVEDVLRGIEGIYYRQDGRDTSILNKLPVEIAKDKKTGKRTITMVYGLGDLKKSLSKTAVDDFFNKCVGDYLDTQSYNNRGDVLRVAKLFKSPEDQVGRMTDKLMPMIERRHSIVHQSDRDYATDADHGKPFSIEPQDVAKWTTAAGALLDFLLQRVPANAAVQPPKPPAVDDVIAVTDDE